MSSKADELGTDVPIPTFALLPSTIALLAFTNAFAPIAVALDKTAEATSAL